MVLILGIESSCDETAAAVVKDGKQVLSNVIATQIPVHRIYGGVVPEIASRHHLESVSPVVEEALSQAGVTLDEIDAIAVTQGPGLVGSLLVGVSYGKALAFAAGKPLLGVHHWEAHLSAIRIEHEIEKPYLALVVSGSHSGLLRVDEQESRFLGMSHDDAAGEAFDKIARALGLPYPGGPEISKAAEKGIPDAVEYPRAWLPDTDDFSFSGLKSAVLNDLNHRRMKGNELSEQDVYDVALAAETSICDVLSAKAVAAAVREKLPAIALVGGVASNKRLRAMLEQRASAHGIRTLWPSPVYCTDNAAMVGVAGYDLYVKGAFADFALNADPRLSI